MPPSMPYIIPHHNHFVKQRREELPTHAPDRHAVVLVDVALRVKIAGIEVQVVRVVTIVRCRRPVVPVVSAIVKRPLIVVARANNNSRSALSQEKPFSQWPSNPKNLWETYTQSLSVKRNCTLPLVISRRSPSSPSAHRLSYQSYIRI